jgi:hypothetical protein
MLFHRGYNGIECHLAKLIILPSTFKLNISGCFAYAQVWAIVIGSMTISMQHFSKQISTTRPVENLDEWQMHEMIQTLILFIL